MRLRSPDGTSVDLRITGYQFPHPEPLVQVFEPEWLEAGAKAGPVPNGEFAGDEDDLVDDDDEGDWLTIVGSRRGSTATRNLVCAGRVHGLMLAAGLTLSAQRAERR
jgi:hypothetical protein